MAKKIIIDFSAQPVIDVVGFSYTITVDSFHLYYPTGDFELKVDFIANGATPTEFYEVAIGTSLDETLQILLSFLRETYQNDLINYSVIDSTIEVLIQADAIITIGEDLNENITITTEDVEPFGTNLKYYLYFDDYTLNIYKRNYQGTASEIFGTFILKKSSVDTILDQIRGTGLDLSLEANQTLTFDEFLLEDEFTYKTELLKGSQIIFEGYIKPDGCQQSFVNDIWYVNIQSNDILGALKDLSFVQTNGLPFTGKMSVYDVIKGCLDRTRLSLDINTSVYVEYIGYTGTNILKDIYVNADRFIKDKNDIIIMDCNEVLTSMLNLFSAVITQQDGQWWIYRPNDLELNGYTEFINQTTNAVFTKNLNAVLGSQINGYYPHHAGANQQIEIKGAISAYRLNYQYGLVTGLVINPTFNFDRTIPPMEWQEDPVFYDWTTLPTAPANVIAYPLLQSLTPRLTIRSLAPGSGTFELIASNAIAAELGETFTLNAKVYVRKYGSDPITYKLKIKTSDGYYLHQNNYWVNYNTTYSLNISFSGEPNAYGEKYGSFKFTTPPLINDCTFQIIICTIGGSYDGIAGYTSIDILSNILETQGLVGEFHTVTRLLPPSSITKENQKVFNGDGIASLIGSIFKDDLTTLTTFWTRKNKFENLPLLGISAMDDLRIQSNPIKLFTGDVYGYIPYFSVITIDNIVGLFMPIEWDYDYKNNITRVKLLQFYNTDIADIQYTISPDYGNNTVKPTIKG
jgi:hypothetical protein